MLRDSGSKVVRPLLSSQKPSHCSETRRFLKIDSLPGRYDIAAYLLETTIPSETTRPVLTPISDQKIDNHNSNRVTPLATELGHVIALTTPNAKVNEKSSNEVSHTLIIV